MDLIITFIVIINIIIWTKIDQSIYKIVSLPFSILTSGYYLAYLLRSWEFLGSRVFITNNISDYTLYLAFGFFLNISGYLYIFINNSTSRAISDRLSISTFSSNYLLVCFFIFSFISIIAFIINLNRITNISLLFSDPRTYELTFGKYSLINYLYFLNVPAIILAITYINVVKKKKIVIYLAIITLVAISFFHGIKYTIFDTVGIPFIFWLHFSKKSLKSKYFYFFIPAFLIIIYLFFTQKVRGGTGSVSWDFFSYILPNYYNFAFSLQSDPLRINGLWSLFWPEKIWSPLAYFSIDKNITGFQLNDSYNMYTGLHSIYGVYWIISPIIVYPLIGIIRNRVFPKNHFIRCISLALIDYCMIFQFYTFGFTKSKYIYYFIITLILYLFYNNKQTKYQTNQLI